MLRYTNRKHVISCTECMGPEQRIDKYRYVRYTELYEANNTYSVERECVQSP